MKVENLADTINEVEDFFNDTDDATLILVVDKFSFFEDSKSSSVNETFDRFLDHCGFTETWPKFRDDLQKPNTYFRRLEPSQYQLIDSVRDALQVVVFGRFRRLTIKLRNDGKYYTSTRRS